MKFKMRLFPYRGKTLSQICLHIIFILISLICIFPLVWTFITSIKSGAEAFEMSLPTKVYFENYAIAWGKATMGRYMINSAIITGGSIILILVCSVPPAYALAKIKSVSYTHLTLPTN